MIQQIFPVSFSWACHGSTWFSDLGKQLILAKSRENISQIFVARNACFGFQIHCFVSKPERVRGNWGRKSRANFRLYDLSKIRGTVDDTSECRFQLECCLETRTRQRRLESEIKGKFPTLYDFSKISEEWTAPLSAIFNWNPTSGMVESARQSGRLEVQW